MPQLNLGPDTAATKALTPRIRSADAGAGADLCVAPYDHAVSVPVVNAEDLNRDDLSGLRLGNFEPGACIGQGGLGQVFRAKHVKLGKTFAVKFLAADLARAGQLLGTIVSATEDDVAQQDTSEPTPAEPLSVITADIHSAEHSAGNAEEFRFESIRKILQRSDRNQAAQYPRVS